LPLPQGEFDVGNDNSETERGCSYQIYIRVLSIYGHLLQGVDAYETDSNRLIDALYILMGCAFTEFCGSHGTNVRSRKPEGLASRQAYSPVRPTVRRPTR